MAEGFDVGKVARLASLGLTEEEEVRLAKEFTDILELVERVRALPLDGVTASVHAHAPPMPVEGDDPRPCLDHSEALSRAPDHDQGHFKVPPILEPGKSG